MKTLSFIKNLLIENLLPEQVSGHIRRDKRHISERPAEFKTITADNGTEFHPYSKIPEALFYA